MQRQTAAMLLLTASLAFVFGASGAGKLIGPDAWVGWIPGWLDGFLGLRDTSWLMVIGLIELFLAFAIVIPVRTVRRIGLIIMALHLLAVLTQVGWSAIGMLDIGLLGSTVALLFLL